MTLLTCVSSCSEVEPESTSHLTPEQLDAIRLEKITEKKLRIASLGSAIVSDPYNNVRRACVSVCVCVTLYLAVFLRDGLKSQGSKPGPLSGFTLEVCCVV